MRLTPGQPAPPLSLPDVAGVTHSLCELRGRRVWLAFFRYASCPLCNIRVHEMIAKWDEWSTRPFALLAVFQSPPDSLARYVGTQEPPFPLLSDPDETSYRAYGCESSLRAYASPANAPALARAAARGFLPGGRMDGTKTRIPADFLVDEGGVLTRCFYGRTVSEHIDLDEVEQWLGS